MKISKRKLLDVIFALIEKYEYIYRNYESDSVCNQNVINCPFCVVYQKNYKAFEEDAACSLCPNSMEGNFSDCILRTYYPDKVKDIPRRIKVLKIWKSYVRMKPGLMISLSRARHLQTIAILNLNKDLEVNENN